MKLFTIGVYGSTESGFFGSLQKAKIDTFCDIRWRRGVRGSEYLYANSGRLQRRLAELGIRYLHFRDLAPNPTLRNCQAKADHDARISRRARAHLSEAFILGYCQQNLGHFDSRKFIDQLGPEARRVVLFCVERAPAACHRSLLAERLHRDLGVAVTHLLA